MKKDDIPYKTIKDSKKSFTLTRNETKTIFRVYNDTTGEALKKFDSLTEADRFLEETFENN